MLLECTLLTELRYFCLVQLNCVKLQYISLTATQSYYNHSNCSRETKWIRREGRRKKKNIRKWNKERKNKDCIFSCTRTFDWLQSRRFPHLISLYISCIPHSSYTSSLMLLRCSVKCLQPAGSWLAYSLTLKWGKCDTLKYSSISTRRLGVTL